MKEITMTETNMTWCFDLKKCSIVFDSGEYKEVIGTIIDCVWCISVYRSRLGKPLYGFELSVDGNENEWEVEVTGTIEKLIINKTLYFGYKWISNIFCTTYTDMKLFLSRNALNINFKFILKTTQKTINKQSDLNAQIATEESHLCQLNELSQDFQAMLLEEHLSDVTVKCKSDVFKVHKPILSARSPVFKTMFLCPMKESATNIVTLDDMDPETIRRMIQFLYGGQIPINSVSEASSLLDVAEKYQITSLIAALINYLKQVLSEKNALNILEMADLYNENLKNDVLKFINDHFDTIKRGTEWEDFKVAKPLLALEVYSYNDRMR